MPRHRTFSQDVEPKRIRRTRCSPAKSSYLPVGGNLNTSCSALGSSDRMFANVLDHLARLNADVERGVANGRPPHLPVVLSGHGARCAGSDTNKQSPARSSGGTAAREAWPFDDFAAVTCHFG